MAQPHPFINVLTPTLSGAGSKKSFSRFNDNGRASLWQSPGIRRCQHLGASHVSSDIGGLFVTSWHSRDTGDPGASGVQSNVGLCHIFRVFSQMSRVFMGYCAGTHYWRGHPHEPGLWPHVNSVESRHHLAWALCLNKHHPSTKL